MSKNIKILITSAVLLGVLFTVILVGILLGGNKINSYFLKKDLSLAKRVTERALYSYEETSKVPDIKKIMSEEEIKKFTNITISKGEVNCYDVNEEGEERLEHCDFIQPEVLERKEIKKNNDCDYMAAGCDSLLIEIFDANSYRVIISKSLSSCSMEKVGSNPLRNNDEWVCLESN